MTAGQNHPTTRHYVRWGKHEPLVEQWTKQPPRHPINPRYRCYEVSVHGEYSWFERFMNIFRKNGWLDAPPADFRWAVLTVHYCAPETAMDRFAMF
jgi:hypothetical protein